MNIDYDNSNSGLTADNLKDAVDELQEEKVDIGIIAGNITLYNTSAASSISTYGRLVTNPSDADYDNPAIDASTGSITGTSQLISSQATDEGIIVGDTGIISLTTIGNIRRTAGSGTATFYFEVYHRTTGGVETLIGTSNNTNAVTSASYVQFFTSTLIANTTFIATDRVVTKFYANLIAGGSNPTYEFQIGGTTPVRTLFPIPFASVSHDALAMVNDAGSGVDKGHITAGTQTIAGTKTINGVTLSSTGSSSNVLREDGTYGAAGSVSPLTTKGDIYTYTTADARLPVGTDDYSIVADSGEATGLTYKFKVNSDTTGVTGADVVTNIMSLTQAEYDAITTPDTATIYNITDAAAAGGGTTYPSNIYESTSQTGLANTVFTFTHNLGFTQADVEAGKYKIVVNGKWSGLGHQYGDTDGILDAWGATTNTAGNFYQTHIWSATSPTTQISVAHQANALKIDLGAQGNFLNPFFLTIQQMYA